MEIKYALIPDVVEKLEQDVGPLLTTQNGRNIGLGAVSKAKFMGEGWIVWTDHVRPPGSAGPIVKAYLSFGNPQQETIFRLKYPHLLSIAKN